MQLLKTEYIIIKSKLQVCFDPETKSPPGISGKNGQINSLFCHQTITDIKKTR